MKSPQTYLLALLALTTLGGAMLAWRQYSELVELRASAMNRDERADLQKRAWDLEKLNQDLQARLAAARPAGGSPELAGPGGERPARDAGGRGGPGDLRARGDGGLQQMNAVRDLLAKPEVQAMINLQQKAGIDARYAALFTNLNLSADQAEKVKALLVERGNTRQDVINVAREQGIDPRENPEAYRRLLTNAQNEINTSIKSVIGETGFAQLQTYEQTLPQRTVANELQQRLSYSSTPLTPAQTEQLVQILATNPPTRPIALQRPAGATGAGGPPPNRAPGPGFDFPIGPPGGGRGSDLGGMMMGALGAVGGNVIAGILDGSSRSGGAPVTNTAVAQAQTVLAPPQLAVLQQIQKEQQAQQQLQQLVRQTLAPLQPPNSGGDRPAPPAGKTPPTGPVPSNPRRPPGGGA